MKLSQTLTILFLLLTTATSANSQESDPIVTESTTTSTVTTNGSMTTTVKSPPPSAISPQIISNGNSDLCTFGVAGAVQTQILGISMGTTVRDSNCETLKRAKVLYDMGMKVAAVSVMCSGSEQVFQAMMDAGTPCPKDGLIGDAAKEAWQAEAVQEEVALLATSDDEGETLNETKAKGAGAVAGVLALILAL